jgi:predicted nucleotidyltransferase
VKPIKPVDPLIARVLRRLDPIAREADCAYFVVGATARDLLLVNVYGLWSGRATRDIDFGVAVASWDGFDLLKERLTATGDFLPDRREVQRLLYRHGAGGSLIPVDLIPFLGVTSAEGTIEWPPSRDIVMNVAGFEKALSTSVPIEMEDGLTVRVASIPGLALLKLMAWADRGKATNKDAADLYRLLTAYADAGNVDRLYDEEMELFESVGFDVPLAGAALLGRDVARLCPATVFEVARSVLEAEASFERLVNQMIDTSAGSGVFPEPERVLDLFRRGFVSGGEWPG